MFEVNNLAIALGAATVAYAKACKAVEDNRNLITERERADAYYVMVDLQDAMMKAANSVAALGA